MSERTRLLEYFDEAINTGATHQKAAQIMGISHRTLKRWRSDDGVIQEDQRPESKPGIQPHQLTVDEEHEIIMTCNLPEYRSLPPSQIVPLLADQGIYIASESTFYRVLHKHEQLNHRGRTQSPKKVPQPTSYTATGPNEVWSWDISYIPSTVKGQYWYLYLVMDIYSRKIVAWEIHVAESGELAKQLIERALIRESCWHNPPVLHSDNGAPMTSYTLKARLAELGMLASHSRPRVSNDNPYSESLFKTVKYCPEWPSEGFLSIEASRDWMLAFEHAYNDCHLHSGLNFVTPNSRHNGDDGVLLMNRKSVYESAKLKNPGRWSGDTRNWEPKGAVSLNPAKLEEMVLNKQAA